MRLEAKHLRRGLLLCALAVTACRTQDSVCGPGGCPDVIGEAGSGGAGGEANGASVNGGGAGGENPAGSPHPGRWLAFIGNDSGEIPVELRALRLDGVTPGPSISISQGVTGELVDIDTWSPDGRHLIGISAASLENIDQQTLFHVEFGSGLPTIETSIPGLPIGTAIRSGPWASDSSAVFVRSFGTRAETYLVHMTSAGTRTELLYRDDEDFPEVGFCADPRWFTRSIADRTWLVSSQHPEQEQLLWSGAGVVTQSPDRRQLLYSDDDTGVWLAKCEAETEVVHLSDKPGWGYWSEGARFVLLKPDDETGIDVLDSEREFQSVFKSPCLDAVWATGSKLLLVCESDESGEREISEIDVSTMPVEASRRGSFHEEDSESWGVLADGTIYVDRPESDEVKSLWVLPKGTTEWRRAASGLSHGAFDFFTPDGNFVVYRDPQLDGSDEFLAFSLHSEQPVALPLLPAPESSLAFVDFYAGGVLIDHLADIDFPFEGQVWWAPLSASSFGPPQPLADVAFAAFFQLQPQP